MTLKNKASVILLAGGQGTRLRALYPHTPKPMIPVGGYPFIEWVIRYFHQQDLRRFIISLGFQSRIAEDYFQQRHCDGEVITTVCESSSLGTGGALLFAQQFDTSSEICVVANGDSMVFTDLSSVWRILEDPVVDVVIIGVEVEDASRYGSLRIGPDGRLLGFFEKQSGQGLINGGVYFFKRRIFTRFPQQIPMSLEVDAFPALLKAEVRILVHTCKDPFIDIGTPESLKEAEGFIRKNFKSGDYS
jgi:D-glycero-alpha-D-manno-heptose 1-phosphate guanylyltransferase